MRGTGIADTISLVDGLVALAVVIGSGCGRLGFDNPPLDAMATDTAMTDAAMTDAASSITRTFGERTTADFRMVTRDTYLSANTDTVDERPFNFGARDELRIRGSGSAYDTLIRFDVGGIAPGTSIESATLELEFTAGAGELLSLHAVLERWDEGDQNGTVGVASWNLRTAGVAWATLGAGPPSSAAPSFKTITVTLGTFAVPIPKSLISSWVDLPSSNFGIVLLSDATNNIRVVSSEGIESQRPLLSITYTK